MKLSQAGTYFNRTPIEGWTGTAWEPLFLYGDFHAYDRFIGPRTFGHKQRIFLIGGDEKIPSTYDYVRIPTGEIYVILSYNSDMVGTDVTGTAYIFHETPHIAKVVSLTSTTSPSGLPGYQEETLGDPIFCDIERYSSQGSAEFDSVQYALYTVILPLSVSIDTDNEVDIDGRRYSIREVNPMLDAQELRAVLRGSG